MNLDTDPNQETLIFQTKKKKKAEKRTLFSLLEHQEWGKLLFSSKIDIFHTAEHRNLKKGFILFSIE